jgi:hypothetical protein
VVVKQEPLPTLMLPTEPQPPPPVKKYYGRKRDEDSSSESSESESVAVGGPIKIENAENLMDTLDQS